MQVYDLQDHRPAPVLRRIYDNLLAAEAAGDARAAYFRTHLRILAAGGDGTVAWLLGTIADLELDPPPHVAVCPASSRVTPPPLSAPFRTLRESLPRPQSLHL